MKFENAHQALETYHNFLAPHAQREEAAQYLHSLQGEEGAIELVRELESDEFGIRWNASNLLSRMGMPAFRVMLEALADPHRISDMRLREGVAHALRENHDPRGRRLAAPVLESMKAPVADLQTLHEAHGILMKMINKEIEA